MRPAHYIKAMTQSRVKAEAFFLLSVKGRAAPQDMLRARNTTGKHFFLGRPSVSTSISNIRDSPMIF